MSRRHLRLYYAAERRSPPDSLVIMNEASYCGPLRTVRPVQCPYMGAGVPGALNNYTRVLLPKNYE